MAPSLLRELASVCYADAGEASDLGDFAECDRLLELAGELHERAEKASGNVLPPQRIPWRCGPDRKRGFSSRSRCGVTLSIRAYQEIGIARVLELFASGKRRVLLVLPTGGGKTVVASELIRRFNQRTLFLAHRRELVRQTFSKLVRNGLSPDGIGIIMSGVAWQSSRKLGAAAPEDLDDDQLWDTWARRRPPAPIQVGSIDTFRTKTPPAAGLVVVDEAHRALAKSYRDVQAHYSESFHLGLTATPFRADGKGLEEAYDEIVVVSTYAELVAEGFLVAPRCFGSKKDVDLSGVRTSKGDYNSEDLAKAVDRAELVGDVVEHWLRLGNNAPTFVFAVNVAHSKHLRDRFLEAGIAAAHVDGTTETSERDATFRALRSGSIKVLCNCDVATEGTDVPCVKTIVLARPTLSERIYLQQVGRGARPFEGKPFVVLDHARCCMEFGLPQEPREYTLQGRKKKKKGASGKPCKKCPGCFAYSPIAALVCDDCGHVFEDADDTAKPLKESDEQLVELTETQRTRLNEWNRLVIDWAWSNIEREASGQKLATVGALKREWTQKTGIEWPPKGSKIPKLTPEQLAYNAELDSIARRVARAYERGKERRERQVERMVAGGAR